MVSKKAQKRKAKAERSKGPKAKLKAKKARQIEKGNKIKESKRKAAAIVGAKTGKKEEKLDEIETVDDLFNSDVFEAGEDPDEESSAGAFHDVDGASDDDELPDLSALDGDDVGASHEKELEAIKLKDPSFYKFLVEHDRQLLDFRDPDAGSEDDEEEDEVTAAGDSTASEKRKAEKKKIDPDRVLTLARTKQIQEASRTSFTAFKAVMMSYHAAIQSIESGGASSSSKAKGDVGDDNEADAQMHQSKSAKRRKKVQQSLMQVRDEAVFSCIIEWTLANIVELMQIYAGETQGSPMDATKCSRWSRLKVIASIFWDETYYLLTHLVDNDMLSFLLRSVSKKEALVYMWPFTSARKKFCNKCCLLWSTSPAHSVRLLSFLFIRNAAAMTTIPLGDKSKRKTAGSELESLMRSVLRAFAEAASAGFSWRSVSTFRFMENCYIELLRIDEAAAYRNGYVCVRQLALILRNACIAISQGGTSKASANQEKQRKKKGLHAQQVQNLVGWPFVCSLSLWTKAIGTLPSLKLLAYPLSMIITGALKSKLTSLQHFPFVYHCFRCLNRLSYSLEVFVPISSHLLKAFSVLIPTITRAYKEKKKGSSKDATPAKEPEIDILLRFSEGQAAEVMTLEAIGGSLCGLLTDHLGLLCRSPSFPEVVAPVLFHVKKFSKHFRSENIRRQLKQLVTNAELTAQEVSARRDLLTNDQMDWKRFFVLEADTPMAKARAELLARKEREERGRIEAETRSDTWKPKRGKNETEQEEKVVAATSQSDNATGEMSIRAKKRARQRERKEEEAREAVRTENNLKKAKVMLDEESRRLPAEARKKDFVEEMGFSSGEET